MMVDRDYSDGRLLSWSEQYEIPAWMTEHIVDVLGGRDFVIELMTEANLAAKSATFERRLLVQDMYGKVMLMEKLHREHMLTEGDEG